MKPDKEIETAVQKTKKQFKKVTGKTEQANKKASEKLAKDMAMISIMFAKGGSEAGVEIMKVAKELHPDAYFFFPLYRGCAVIPKQEYTGSLEMILYHDPCWMGHDAPTTENLPNFMQKFRIDGQRSGQDFWLNEKELDRSDFIIRNFIHDIESEAGWASVKAKNPKATSYSYGELDKEDVKKRMTAIFIEKAKEHGIVLWEGKEDADK